MVLSFHSLQTGERISTKATEAEIQKAAEKAFPFPSNGMAHLNYIAGTIGAGYLYKFPFPSNGRAHLNPCFLNPCTSGAKNPKTKREQDGAFSSAKCRRKIAGTFVPPDPNTIFLHDAAETLAGQRFGSILGAAVGDCVHRVCLPIFNRIPQIN